MERQLAKLAVLLESLTPEEIIAFDTVSETYHRSNHHDLWAVAYIINGGCSDDGFDYFRRWLWAQGREVYEATVNDPDSLADRIPPDGRYLASFEEFFSVANDVYKAKTGEELTDAMMDLMDDEVDLSAFDIRGERWEEADLPRRFPKTWAKFGWLVGETGDAGE